MLAKTGPLCEMGEMDQLCNTLIMRVSWKVCGRLILITVFVCLFVCLFVWLVVPSWCGLHPYFRQSHTLRV